MKIGVLGGSFNPPHTGHLFIATQVKLALMLDQVWLMPCHHHPFNKSLESPERRLEMTKLLEQKDIIASDFEIKQNKESYTVDTLRLLILTYPNDTFYWILGSDQLDAFQNYKDWKEIITTYNLVIFPRKKPLTQSYVKTSLHLKSIPKNITILTSTDLVIADVSSTKIKELLQKGEDISCMVPTKVREFILRNKLYQ